MEYNITSFLHIQTPTFIINMKIYNIYLLFNYVYIWGRSFCCLVTHLKHYFCGRHFFHTPFFLFYFNSISLILNRIVIRVKEKFPDPLKIIESFYRPIKYFSKKFGPLQKCSKCSKNDRPLRTKYYYNMYKWMKLFLRHQ